MKKRYAYFLVASFAAVLISCFLYYNFQSPANKDSKVNNSNDSLETETVRGTSMSPFLKSGQEIKVNRDYYNENEILKGDVVLVDFSWREDDLVKFVRAVPGDSFSLKKQKDGGYHILVNGKALKNSQGEFYSLSSEKSRMLNLYIKDFGGIIPDNTYLVLGNKIQGTEDSTKFGLISRENISGKVILE